MTVTSVGTLAVTPEDFPGVLGSTPCAYPLRLLLAVAALPPGSVAEPENRGALEWSAASVRLPATGKCAIQMAALHFACVYRDSPPQLGESRFDRVCRAASAAAGGSPSTRTLTPSESSSGCRRGAPGPPWLAET